MAVPSGSFRLNLDILNMDTRKAPENTRRPSRFTFAAHKATTRPPATACCVLPSLGGERALGAPRVRLSQIFPSPYRLR